MLLLNNNNNNLVTYVPGTALVLPISTRPLKRMSLPKGLTSQYWLSVWTKQGFSANPPERYKRSGDWQN